MAGRWSGFDGYDDGYKRNPRIELEQEVMQRQSLYAGDDNAGYCRSQFASVNMSHRTFATLGPFRVGEHVWIDERRQDVVPFARRSPPPGALVGFVDRVTHHMNHNSETVEMRVMLTDRVFDPEVLAAVEPIRPPVPPEAPPPPKIPGIRYTLADGLLPLRSA